MDERYSRNNFTNDEQKKLAALKVLIAGLGGLGSGVLSALAGLGVGHFVLLDCDVVELSNLNRQFIHRTKDIGVKKIISAKRWVNEFNPEAKVEIIDTKLTSENKDLIKGIDLIVDCFDNVESKLVLNDIALAKNSPLIHGGVDGMLGQIMCVNPGQTPCLKCILGINEVKNASAPTSLAPVVNVVSSLQATEAMKILLGRAFLKDHLLRVDLENLTFKKIAISKNPNCCK